MVKNVIPIHRSGYNPNLQNGVEETIWSYSSGDPYFATVANTVSVVSSSSSDTGVDITIDGLDNEIEYDDSNFVDNIKQYLLDLSEYEKPEELTNLDIYKIFLRTLTFIIFIITRLYI